jgi:hypothetical protein
MRRASWGYILSSTSLIRSIDGHEGKGREENRGGLGDFLPFHIL